MGDSKSDHSSSKHCGLPSFVRHLPEAENREVLSIWKEYKLGEDCTDERRETQEIIDNLPNDVRAMVFGRVPSFLTNASADVNNLSSAAKEVYEKLQHLKAERAKIMEEMTDDVRKELRRLFRKSKIMNETELEVELY
ncbi:hypothetical protein DINM_006803 [Dirofilaria immitis]|nr:hypothetical protein [Dirofilaria immitis]